jgi:tellurite resistance protein
MRKLRVIEALQLWTHEKYAQSEMGGEFLEWMQREARGDATEMSSESVELSVPPTQSSGFNEAEEAIVDTGMFIASIDGAVSDPELNAIAESLRRMTGRRIDEQLISTLQSRPIPPTAPLIRLRTRLTATEHQLLLLQLAELTAADGVVSADERTSVLDLAQQLDIPQGIINAVLGGPSGVDSDGSSAAMGRNCGACGVILVAGAKFCSACGTRVSVVPRDCPHCRVAVPPSAAYCVGCGAKL